MEYLQGIISVFQKGGLVMYPLTACSIVVVAIAVERFGCYRRAQGNSERLLENLSPRLAENNWSAAVKVCRDSDGVAATVLAAGLQRLTIGRPGLESVLESEATLVAASLRNRLDYLDTIVTMAPLLGLLGTVMGMIGTFSVLNVRTGQTQAITGGVGEALVATAFGLCVAILALAVHSYFKHWLDGIITDLEKVCNILLDKASQGDGR